MNLSILTLSSVVVGAWWWCYLIAYYKSKISSAPLPPGPFPFPIVGSLFSLRNPLHRHFAKLSRKYGPIMYIKIGMVPCVVVSNAHAAEQFLKVHDVEFASRPGSQGWLKHFSFEWKDMAFSPISKTWRTMKRISNVHLFSNNMLSVSSGSRHAELQIAVDSILELSEQGKPVDLRRLTGTWLSDSICCALFGRKDLQLRELFDSVASMALNMDIGELIPALDWLDLHGMHKKMGRQIMPQLKYLLKGVIEEHRQNKATAGENFVCKDFTDVLISLEGEDTLEDISIVALLCDMLLAGLDTTRVAIEWAFAEMTQNPQIMLEAQEELDRVIGRSRPVEESDIAKLPYIQAIMKEALRLHPPGPLGLPHFNQKEVKLGGYTIPARCKVLINLWAIGRDPDYWSDPDQFKPERFLDSNINVTGQHFQLIPFSTGRRICTGYPLAIRLICLPLATLLQKFEWNIPMGYSASVKEGPGNITCHPESELVLMACPRTV